MEAIMSQNTAKKSFRLYDPEEDHLQKWKASYLEEVIREERSHQDYKKVERFLNRFINFIVERYDHDKVSAVVKRDVKDWLDKLYENKDKKGYGFAPNYVNNHQSVLTQWLKWIRIKAPGLQNTDPTKGVRDIFFTEPQGRALTPIQLLSLKNICDRLERFHLKTDKRRSRKTTEIKQYARPLRDRAIVYVFLSTGLRREELCKIDIEQLEPTDPNKLRNARGAKISRVRGKGRTERTVYLSAEARHALADYLESERRRDTNDNTVALFLSALGTQKRKVDGRFSPRTINGILEQIGIWHDAEQDQPHRKISPLTPHDLRHTFANVLKKQPGVTDQDWMNLMGWRNTKQIPRYTKDHDEVYSDFVEKM